VRLAGCLVSEHMGARDFGWTRCSKINRAEQFFSSKNETGFDSTPGFALLQATFTDIAESIEQKTLGFTPYRLEL
jgi:hypothetical protein